MHPIANPHAGGLTLSPQRAQAKRVTRACAVASITAVMTTLCVTAAQAAPVSYTATLSGANEVPVNGSANTGRTRFILDPVSNAVSWVTKTTITANVGHHLHAGAVGTNGPVIVNFNAAYSGTAVVTTAQATNIVANPANFYVNLHTSLFPGGEIRGPLVADGLTCTLDIDDDGQIDAATDGLLITRAMLGLTGTDVTHNATSPNGFRTSWADIRSYLNSRCGTNFAP